VKKAGHGVTIFYNRLFSQAFVLMSISFQQKVAPGGGVLLTVWNPRVSPTTRQQDTPARGTCFAQEEMISPIH
jgi:hypothetical protein